jgi:hypothetical protein
MDSIFKAWSVLQRLHMVLSGGGKRCDSSACLEDIRCRGTTLRSTVSAYNGPLFQGRFKAILHEPAEALKINRYIHLNLVRIAAFGGHETRDVAAHEITAQLARRRVDAWNNTIGFLRFLRWNPSSTRLAMHRVHLGVLRSRLAMRAPKGVSSTVAESGSHRTLGDGLEGAKFNILSSSVARNL